MRHKRAKQNRRTLQFYERVSNIRAPYHIVLDGPFLVAIHKFNIEILPRLDTLLSNATKVCILPSTMTELTKLYEMSANENVKQALAWCKKHCLLLKEEEESPTTTSDVADEPTKDLSIAAKAMLRFVMKNPRYFVASQDTDLLRLVRRQTIPIIRLSRTVLLLEAPNAQHAPSERQTPLPAAEQELVRLVQRQTQPPTSNDTTKRRTQQKAKGPNPLSCKKRKQETTKKRTRRKKARSDPQAPTKL